ncbi:MAG TPA: c-type cytochrome [Solirubrobacterales bacterium]|jgi:mono/diheme cytochrome c family protein|nr:c-type cytochrome [Solirubrobacterales bacterium]HMU26128.1 c-type cytochrome [Solirubrobacterales bacterium]HMX71692.1 c-type cytochrome [Solirubrobacterales bacterium]HMY25775.1 c-type cytochrome [Solirubrobacterales bacterium]HNA23114.1 c-type cytochrome [Solirubrobacterales bacterium]
MKMNKFSTKLPVLLASVAILGAVIAGCGTSSSNSDPEELGFQDRGRQLFNANCGTCHVLAQAASTGTQGPNLDDAFAAARLAGVDDDTIKGIVRAQVHRPQVVNGNYPGVTMPANLLEGNDLEDVAAYVAAVAGVPGIEPPKAPGEGAGAQIYANNGCGSCHTLAAAQSAGTLGPNLDEVLPKMSKAEIHEAIVNPGAKVENGYPNAMPSDYASKISEEQLNQLIEFLMTSAAADANG